MMQSRIGGLICVGAILTLAIPAWAQVVDTAGRDNTLYESVDGSLSNGAGEHLFVGRTNQLEGSVRRCLLYFDLAYYGDPYWWCDINGVELEVHVSMTTSGPTTVSLHRMLRDWGEGTSDAPGGEGAGTAAGPDDATWIHAFHDTSLWMQPGSDYDTVASAVFVLDTVGTYIIGEDIWPPPFPNMVTDVHRWVNGIEPNYGWILIGDESTPGTSKRIDSRENATVLFRPILRTWAGPCECGWCYYLGDLNRDGFPDAVDLNMLIEVLFFNAPNPWDPFCPIYLGDFDASSFTDVVDLNHMIEFLYFGGPGPCDPCACNGAVCACP